MTHPSEWLIGAPCPMCGSPDILVEDQVDRYARVE